MTAVDNYPWVAAIRLLLSWDNNLWEMIWLALRIGLASLVMASFIGLPLGGMLAVKRFSAKPGLIALADRLIGLPLMVAGLVIYLLLSQVGTQSVFGLLYRPTTLIIVQAIFISPLVIALTRHCVEVEWKRLRPQFRSWRMTAQQALPTLFWEARRRVFGLILVGFRRTTLEIGLVMFIGGILSYFIPSMTLSTPSGTSMDNMPLAFALGLLLFVFALLISTLLYLLRNWQLKQG